MQANSFFRKEAGIVLKRDGRVGLQLHKNCLPKKKKKKEKKPRPIRAWKLHEQQKDAQANTLQSRVIHCSKMACTSQKLCSWWAQSKKGECEARWTNTILGCSRRLLHDSELLRALQGALCTLPIQLAGVQLSFTTRAQGCSSLPQLLPGAQSSLWQPKDCEKRRMLNMCLSSKCWDRNSPKYTGEQSQRRWGPLELILLVTQAPVLPQLRWES